MKQVQDNFSGVAAEYAAFRPQSPEAIYDFLFSHVKNFGTAWDCGTGNGQVACRLAERFGKVYGTDISEEQLRLAPAKDNIAYLRERAEATRLPENSIDLITIAQAIHWFDFDAFYKEVRRVGRPGGLIAAWTYNLLKLTPELNAVIDHFYYNITHAYWDKERDLVDAGYSTIPFPFAEIQAPEINIVQHWTIHQLMGYLRTWSGVRHYMQQEKNDPVLLIAHDLENAWGSTELLEVRWPVFVRAGFIK
ncbi:MAG: class I SAM-dependent methyltransferase [Taibaiella sp.]|nr:class I SAM-dependent methyltransferase [Taibaiella sp.]